MRSTISDGEVEEFLAGVEAGALTLTAVQHPQEVYCGGVEYVASNGWRLVLFNDCNEWDYIESLVADDGRVAKHDATGNEVLDAYRPTAEIAWSRYGLPGYCAFRCTNCSAAIQCVPGDTGDFLCASCRRRATT